jgi:hypothetical protein
VSAQLSSFDARLAVAHAAPAHAPTTSLELDAFVDALVPAVFDELIRG